MLALVPITDPVLVTRCEEVTLFDTRLADVAEQMLAVMRHNGGIGLAANQVGVSLRLFVIDQKLVRLRAARCCRRRSSTRSLPIRADR